jgi:ribonuclease P protein component
VLREGERFEARHVRLIATPARGTVGRVGFVIGKRELKLAVDRNYARRLMREAARSRRPGIERFDIVLRLRSRCESADLLELGSEAAAVLDALLRSKAR